MFLHFMYSMFYEECFNQLLNWLFNLKAWVVGFFFIYFKPEVLSYLTFIQFRADFHK